MKLLFIVPLNESFHEIVDIAGKNIKRVNCCYPGGALSIAAYLKRHLPDPDIRILDFNVVINRLAQTRAQEFEGYNREDFYADALSFAEGEIPVLEACRALKMGGFTAYLCASPVWITPDKAAGDFQPQRRMVVNLDDNPFLTLDRWLKNCINEGRGSEKLIEKTFSSMFTRKLWIADAIRESFRPFAQTVIKERPHEYFELDRESPCMLAVVNADRSTIPAVTHVDDTARIQTIDKEDNDFYYRTIETFEKLTGCAVIVNTSFNVRRGTDRLHAPAGVPVFHAHRSGCLDSGRLSFEERPAAAGKRYGLEK